MESEVGLALSTPAGGAVGVEVGEEVGAPDGLAVTYT
jgi:hypothetical protein